MTSNLINMKSKLYEVKAILRKTKAKFFVDLKVGDVIQFDLDIEPIYRGRSGLRTTDVHVTNHETDVDAYCSMNMINNYIECFELEEFHVPVV